MGILSFLRMTALAVASLYFAIEQIENSGLKYQLVSPSNLVKTLDLTQPYQKIACSGPQLNRPSLVECPWKSQNVVKLFPNFCLKSTASLSSRQLQGQSILLVYPNFLFKSLPASPVLKLPMSTPSGFSMGTILKAQCLIRKRESQSSESSLLMSPQSIKDEFGQPEWILAETRTTCFPQANSPMLSRGISSPPRVCPRTSRVSSGELSLLRYFLSLEQVYGMEYANWISSPSWNQNLKDRQ